MDNETYERLKGLTELDTMKQTRLALHEYEQAEREVVEAENARYNAELALETARNARKQAKKAYDQAEGDWYQVRNGQVRAHQSQLAAQAIREKKALSATPQADREG